MSSCAMLSYNNFTAAAFDCCVATAARYGVTISSDSGSGSAHGFTVAWRYNRAAQTMTIQCTGKPFFVSCGAVNGKINEAVEECLTAHEIELAPMVHD